MASSVCFVILVMCLPEKYKIIRLHSVNKFVVHMKRQNVTLGTLSVSIILNGIVCIICANIYYNSFRKEGGTCFYKNVILNSLIKHLLTFSTSFDLNFQFFIKQIFVELFLKSDTKSWFTSEICEQNILKFYNRTVILQL